MLLRCDVLFDPDTRDPVCRNGVRYFGSIESDQAEPLGDLEWLGAMAIVEATADRVVDVVSVQRGVADDG
ncbi:MAG: hypothetical protein M0Z46_11595 [Actinomycetota bacterium]|nr:hypothetical protein [Actinomycetota bacterium]MDA8358452.1 hypothetical protein [Actinomycetota bacterium]